mgnify:CR=1 FL=1
MGLALGFLLASLPELTSEQFDYFKLFAIVFFLLVSVLLDSVGQRSVELGGSGHGVSEFVGEVFGGSKEGLFGFEAVLLFVGEVARSLFLSGLWLWLWLGLLLAFALFLGPQVRGLPLLGLFGGVEQPFEFIVLYFLFFVVF